MVRVVAVCAAALLAYAFVYGPSVAYSVDQVFVFGGEETYYSMGTEYALAVLLSTLLVVGLLLAAVRVDARFWPGLGRWPWSSKRLPRATVIGGTGLVMAAISFGDLILAPAIDGWGLFNSAYGEDPPVLEDVFWALDAGIGEEIIVLAVPVTILCFLRVPLRWALVVLVSLRVAYHLYYNAVGVIWLLPWAIVSVLVYWQWSDRRLLVGLISAHALFNLRGVIFGDYGHFVYALIALLVIAVAFLEGPAWYRQAAMTPAVVGDLPAHPGVGDNPTNGNPAE